MLHPSLHGYHVGQHQHDLERAAQRERLIAEAHHAATNKPTVAERTRLITGNLLIALGQRLCAHGPTEPQNTLLHAPSRDLALSPLSTWSPAMLARLRDASESRTPTTFVYYGFVIVGARGITRTEYVTPLGHPVVSGRLDARKGG